MKRFKYLWHNQTRAQKHLLIVAAFFALYGFGLHVIWFIMLVKGSK